MAESVDDTYGNGQARPRSDKNENAIAQMVDAYANTSEQSFQESTYYADSQVKPYNPDDLVRKAGDYSIYEDMLKDDQVSIALQLKKDLVLASGYDIVLEDDDESGEAIKEDLEVALREDPEVSFDDSLQEMLTAYDNGFSLSEKVFKHRPDGSLTLKCIKTRHPSSWLIHTDEHGNVTRYEQRGPKASIDVDPRALIHLINEPKYGNAYGTSDLRAAHTAWFAKTQVVKFYAIYLEKAASPTPVARYDKNAPQAAVDEIFSVLKKFQAKTAIAIPKEIEVEFIEAKTNGEAYRKAIDMFNMFIGRSLFVPDLLGFQGGEISGGSYSLGKEQLDVLFKHIGRRRQVLERAINHHIIKPIVINNHGLVEKFPKFKLRPVRDSDMIELAKLWLDAAKSKFFQPSDEEINHFRSITKFPEGAVEVIEPNPAPGFEDEEDEEDKSKDETAAGGDGKPGKAKFALKPPGDYAKKVNFKKIERSMDAYLDTVLDEARPVAAKIMKDIGEQLKRKKIIESQDLDKIDSVRAKYKTQLAKVFGSSFNDAFKDSAITAQSELDGGIKKFTTPLLDEDFLEFLASETWQFVGDWEYNLKKRLRLELAAAIKDGKPLSEVIDSILGEEGMELSDTSIERYARTKFTEVVNRGRHATFEASGVVAAYQYSAILDDRTTDICAGLDGKIFEKGQEPIPPLHFNCRSLLIPITKYEEYEPSKNMDAFIEKNIGEGFSKQ